MPDKVLVNTADVTPSMTISGSQRALTRISNGRLWVVYKENDAIASGQPDGLAHFLFGAYSDDLGDTWTEESVARSLGDPNGIQLIMVDSAGLPHVIYHARAGVADPNTHRIYYSNRSTMTAGPQWGSRNTVHQDIPINSFSACIDSADIFHIVFSDANGNHYITGSHDSWSAAELINADDDYFVDITVDANDVPMIVFSVFGTGDERRLYYRDRIGGSWNAREEVSPVQELGSTFPSFVLIPISIAIDSSNDLHVAWSSRDLVSLEGSVWYRKREGGIWRNRIEVRTHPNVGDSESMGLVALALDDTDNVWIVYQQASPLSGGDEAIRYKRITAGILGDEITPTGASTILRPDDFGSVYAILWQRYPSSAIMPVSNHPVIAISDEKVSTNARIYFWGSPLGGNPLVQIGPPAMPTEGRDRVAAIIETDTSIYIAVGTGNTAPASGDTTLVTETFREVADSVVRDGNIITYRTKIANGSLPATTAEAGIFLNSSAAADSGELLVRATLNFASADGDDLTLVFEVQIDEG